MKKENELRLRYQLTSLLQITMIQDNKDSSQVINLSYNDALKSQEHKKYLTNIMRKQFNQAMKDILAEGN